MFFSGMDNRGVVIRFLARARDFYFLQNAYANPGSAITEGKAAGA
jgi:hypothetical protein